MDISSVMGVMSGIVLIVIFILTGGSIQNFFNLPGLIIVIGGTMASTLLSFKFKDIVNSFKALAFVFTNDEQDPEDLITTMIKLSKVSRKEGLLKLSKIETDSAFLSKAVTIISDAPNPSMFRKTMRIEIEALKMRHFKVQNLFKKMGTYSPAFGMLGTLIGLIKMLTRLEDPSSIGPAMAIALLTTFYGSLLSTFVFLPIANKLKEKTMLEVMNMEIIFEACIALLEELHPVYMYEKLSSFMPLKEREPVHIKPL